MDKSNELYLSTPPGRLFRKAAIPNAISMLTATLFSLVDGIFVGQICGEIAFAVLCSVVRCSACTYGTALEYGT